MNKDDVRFFLELAGARREEIEFLVGIWENPDDKTRCLVYADWLEDHGRTEGAKMVRGGCVPGLHNHYHVSSWAYPGSTSGFLSVR
jgi:uncharacterized protein (TIGR02996 family)